MEKQELAVIRNEPHNRVIAGPGTGKTHSLPCRTQYLIDRGVPSDDLTVLAFNKHTQEELKRRLRSDFNVSGVAVRTFHSFGQSIVSDAYPKEFVLVGQPRLREVGRLIRMLRNTHDEFPEHYEEFIELYRANEFTTDSSERDDFFDSINYRSGKSFRGEEPDVSDEEPTRAYVRIAGTLFRYGIEYRYRQYADWADPVDRGAYIPDFTLPEHNVTVEYLPSDDASHERRSYERRRPATQLRSLNQDADRASILIHGNDLSLSNIVGILRAKLDQEGVSTDTQKTEERLSEQTYEHNILWRDVEALFADFIKKAKTDRIDDSELATRISKLDADENELRYRFSAMGATLLSAYRDQYAEYGAYDYEDMMLRAGEIAQSNTSGEHTEYRHVLVDEFQDLILCK